MQKDDVIYRQAAVDAIHCDITVTGKQNAELVASTIGAFGDRIKALPSAQPAQKWIPCSERLPEEDHWLGGSGKQFSDNVLVSVYNSDDEDEWVDVSQTIDGEWRIELPRHCKIVAWMPLPEPYKEGGAGCMT